LGIAEMDWEKYFRFFCWGMQKFVLKEDVKPPTELLKHDIVKNVRRKVPKPEESSFLRKWFPDISWAFSKNYHTNVGIDNFNTLRNPEETKALIIRSRRVQDAIKEVAASEGVQQAVIEKRAQAVLDRMAHTLTLKIVRAVGWFLRKVWRQIFQVIHVEEQGIEKIRTVLTNGPIVLIPTHRSYLDFLLISYIFYEYDLPLPHIAAGEDFLAVFFVNWIFRNSGAFFLRRSFKSDTLYLALFTEYVQRLVSDWSPVEFFIEGKRSRTGKSLHPKFGLLGMCLDPYLQQKVPDITFVPISISYERVIEAELYSNELMGEQKIKESFKGLIQARKILKMNFGRIHVIFNEPISAKQFTDQFILHKEPSNNNNANIIRLQEGEGSSSSSKSATQVHKPLNLSEEDKKLLVQSLAYTISLQLNKGLVVTPTSLVASVLLTHRKGISSDDLTAQVDWLRDYVEKRNGFVSFEGTTHDLMDHALKLLNNNLHIVRGNYVPATSGVNGKQNQALLILDYYRNQIVHLFAQEAMIAISINSLIFHHHKGNIAAPVDRKDLVNSAKFLRQLLWLEFVTDPSTSIEQDMLDTIESMVKRGFLVNDKSNNSVIINSGSEGYFSFLCHFFWPLVDTYWVSALSLFSLQPHNGVKKRLHLQRTQWLGERMFNEGKLAFYETCSMEALLNTLELFQNWRVIQCKDDDDSKKVPMGSKGRLRRTKSPPPENPLVTLVPPYDKEQALQSLIEQIGKYKKPATNYFTSSLKSAIIADFPVLSKL